jgi:hypothetical protein
MTKCAVGAMLFGGTLGLAQAASAAVVTFLNTGPGAASSYSYLRAVGSTLAGMSQQVAGFAAGSISKQNTTNTVVLDWTAPVPAGVFSDSITMKASRSSGTVSAGTQPISANFYRTFTVTGGSAVWQGSLASNGYVGNLEFQILLLDPTTGLGTVEAFGLSVNASGNEVENFSGTLAAGTYSMYTAFGIQQSTSLSTFATFSIPAPGAVALLGAAGLIGARRRRD